MRELAEICGAHAVSVQTQNTVKRLEKERYMWCTQVACFLALTDLIEVVII